MVTLQTIALEILPLVGRPLSFLLWRCAAAAAPRALPRRLTPWPRRSILYAYNSFEYKWSMHGLSLPERLRACEDNWCVVATVRDSPRPSADAVCVW